METLRINVIMEHQRLIKELESKYIDQITKLLQQKLFIHQKIQNSMYRQLMQLKQPENNVINPSQPEISEATQPDNISPDSHSQSSNSISHSIQPSVPSISVQSETSSPIKQIPAKPAPPPPPKPGDNDEDIDVDNGSKDNMDNMNRSKEPLERQKKQESVETDTVKLQLPSLDLFPVIMEPPTKKSKWSIAQSKWGINDANTNINHTNKHSESRNEKDKDNENCNDIDADLSFKLHTKICNGNDNGSKNKSKSKDKDEVSTTTNNIIKRHDFMQDSSDDEENESKSSKIESGVKMKTEIKIKCDTTQTTEEYKIERKSSMRKKKRKRPKFK